MAAAKEKLSPELMTAIKASLPNSLPNNLVLKTYINCNKDVTTTINTLKAIAPYITAAEKPKGQEEKPIPPVSSKSKKKANPQSTQPPASEDNGKKQKGPQPNAAAQTAKQSRKTKRAVLLQQFNLIKQLPLAQDRIRAYTLTGIKVMVLVRGCPGSGKTTKAVSVLKSCGIVYPEQNLFTADDFFSKEPKNKNVITIEVLDEARKWNESRVHAAVKKQITPVFVDDCLLKKMDLKTFYGYATKGGYAIEILEPDSSWANIPEILISRTHCIIALAEMRQMVEIYESIISAQHLLLYFKMQYNPGQEPPQKGECLNTTLTSSKENLSVGTPKADKPNPSTKETQLSNDKGVLKEIFSRLQNLKVDDGEATDHVLFSKQNSPTEKVVKNLENELITVSFARNSILQLQNLFGGYLAPNMLDDENMISMPYGLARQLHCYVMESVEDDMFEKEQSLAKGIEADLQAREDAKKGLKEKFNVSQLMEEELSKVHQAVKNGTPSSSVSAKLPLKLLFERFPDADSALIGRILSDTDNSLRKATSLITSLPDPDTLVFKDVMEEGVISEVDRTEAVNQALVYRDVASKFYEQMIEYSEKARGAYKEGHRTVATFYYELGKWHKEQIEKANVLAAKALLMGKEKTDTLDLHFLAVKEAMQVMDLFVDANVRSMSTSGEKSVFLFIITGRGAHSNYGNAVLKHSAKKRLAERNIQYWEMNPGMLKLSVRASCLMSCDL